MATFTEKYAITRGLNESLNHGRDMHRPRQACNSAM